MNEFLVFSQPQVFHELFEEVLHGLDIVARNGFYFFDSPGILRREVEHGPLHQQLQLLLVNIAQRRQRYFAEHDEVLHFDPHPIADESVFREVGAKRFRSAGIAAVYGRDGCEHRFSFRGKDTQRDGLT